MVCCTARKLYASVAVAARAAFAITSAALYSCGPSARAPLFLPSTHALWSIAASRPEPTRDKCYVFRTCWFTLSSGDPFPMRAQPILQPHSCGETDASFALLIEGRWSTSPSATYLSANHPYLQQNWGRIADATASDIDAAVQSASRAFADGRWSGRVAGQRARSLFRLADLIDHNADALITQ